MKSFMHLFVAILSVVMISACGKTSSEQAKDTADSAISDFKTSANAVDALGTPSSYWTDAQFDQYEATVRDCSAKADRVESLDGKDGVIVYGTWNLPTLRRLLANKLEKSSQARRDKLERETILKQTASLDAASVRYKAHLTAIQAAGTPSTAWSFEQLDQYEAHLNGIETEAQGLNASLGYERPSTTDLLRSVRSLRETVQTIRLAKGQKPAA